jgi:predicted nucleotidyltransferase
MESSKYPIGLNDTDEKKEQRMTSDRHQLSEPYQSDVQRAVRILKEAGCTDVFLFGSAAAAEVSDQSDIDLAVRGCPGGQFFYLLGRLLLELDRPVDLVNLDRDDAFARYLEREGELHRVA